MHTPDFFAGPPPGSDPSTSARRAPRMLTPSFVLAVAASLGACSETSATAPVSGEGPALMSASAHIGANIVLDDASSRIAGAVEIAEHRARLVHLLEQLQHAVEKEDVAAARRFIASTRSELARGLAADASDADALLLSLDAVEAQLPSSDAPFASTPTTSH